MRSKVQWVRKGRGDFSPLFIVQEWAQDGGVRCPAYKCISQLFSTKVQCSSAMGFCMHSSSVQCTSPLKGERCYCTGSARAPVRNLFTLIRACSSCRLRCFCVSSPEILGKRVEFPFCRGASARFRGKHTEYHREILESGDLSR
jgi:hypothetical protein